MPYGQFEPKVIGFPPRGDIEYTMVQLYMGSDHDIPHLLVGLDGHGIMVSIHLKFEGIKNYGKFEGNHGMVPNPVGDLYKIAGVSFIKRLKGDYLINRIEKPTDYDYFGKVDIERRRFGLNMIDYEHILRLKERGLIENEWSILLFQIRHPRIFPERS